MIDSETFLRSHPVVIGDGTELLAAVTESVSLASSARRRPGQGEPGQMFVSAVSGEEAAAAEEDPELDERCLNSALKSLDAAGASSAGLRDRLLRKDFDQLTVDRVIRALERMRLLDDDAYAQALLDKALGKQLGAYGARREMAQKKVDPALAEQLIETAREEGLFEESARQLVADTVGRLVGEDKQVVLRRLYSAAQRKGQNMADIQSALADYQL